MESTNESNLFELQIDHNGSAFLKEAARWAKFLAILGFIFCGLYVLFALFAGSIFATAFRSFGSAGVAYSGSGFISLFYIAFAILYFFPCLYFYNFAVKMQAALRENNQDQLNGSFKNLKSCYRFLGILTIIILGFMVLGIIIALISLGSLMR
jgi:hypothetical protein